LLVLFLVTGSCSRGLPGSLAVLDPVLPVIAPGAAAAIGRQSRKTIVLPDEASENLYALLAEEAPDIVFLSPLLAPELERILGSAPEIRIVYLGSFNPVPAAGLYSAGFSSIDAAELAGKVLADQARTMPDTVLSAGIFTAGAVEAAERFTSSYLAGKPGNTPIIEYIAGTWSAATANRLRTLDIRQVYLAVPGKDAARWAREAFPASTYVLLELPLGGDIDPSLDAMIVWDIETGLKTLIKALDVSESASIGGTWKLLGR
jgi:hypothetical protein